MESELDNQNYNSHYQCIVDFDFIYEDPKESRLFDCGIFVTNYKDSQTISLSTVQILTEKTLLKI